MTLVPTTPPAIEPVTLAEAKAHLRVDAADEDALVASLVTAARVQLERLLGRAFITQAWSYYLDAWPRGAFVPLPLSPVQSVTAVRIYAADNTSTELGPGATFLDGLGNPPRLIRAEAETLIPPGRRANGIEIAFIAGHGSAAADVPQPLRQAILLLVAHWFENRAPVLIGEAAVPVPLTLMSLIAPYRQVRL